MVDIVKGGGRAPPPLQAGLILPLRWNVLQKVAIATLLYSQVCVCSTTTTYSLRLSVHVFEFFFSVKINNIVLIQEGAAPNGEAVSYG
jgi:hypothetical protein